MSEFRFNCPECGQKILGDAAYSGRQIPCPTCQKTITVPNAAPLAAAPVAPPGQAEASAAPPAPKAPPIPRPAASPAAAGRQQAPGPLSALAVASLMCSVFVPLGCIPGLICGHMAKARMRRDFFLEGEKMANAGLLISYCVLMAVLTVGGIGLLEYWHFSPVKVRRSTPQAIAAIQWRVVDNVIMGENEDDHEVDGVMHYTNPNGGKPFHSATRGGSFSYVMHVKPDRAMTLDCRFWGSERRGHLFDIAVDNQVIATQDLTLISPGEFIDVEYKIPAGLTRGKTQVKVEFQAHPGMTAGGLYGCRMLLRSSL